MKFTILILPGYAGSGPNHWQSRWEKGHPDMVRVEQEDWDAPTLDGWSSTLDNYVKKAEEPVVLVAHSMSCALIAHWCQRYDTSNVLCALLVAPSDVDSPAFTPDAVRCCAPIPIDPLPFPSLVIASDDDPFVSLQRARYFAESWGSQFINMGSFGHINADSCLGDWPQGLAWLNELITETLSRKNDRQSASA